MARLTPKQAEAFGERIGATVGFLFRARERMQTLGFAHDDRLYQAVVAAQDAMYALRIHLHYASCERGVGEPTTKPPDPPA
ncbi:MAG TPA: hypothetical protein VKJ47_07275 [Candidatus Binatia bacterium]|nr:hypothetical protein [Candidatus Binatia bacterium]